MTPEHIAAVRRSFTRICGRHGQLADMFRANALRRDATLAALYADDPAGHHLLQMFAAIVALLNKPALLLPALRRLGRRVGIAQAAQISSFGRALIDTLRQALGEDWGAATEGAWTTVYAELSMTVLAAMIEVAAEREPAAAPRAARPAPAPADALAA